MIHATRVDRVFDGIDLVLLGEDLKPDRLVLDEELLRTASAADRWRRRRAGLLWRCLLRPPGRDPHACSASRSRC